MGCGACRQGFGTVEATRGREMMSAVAVRTGLPGTSLRVDGETLVGTKSQVEPLESELIQRVFGGQQEAFRELVRPCERAVFMATQAILKSEADAQDAAQEAILKAFANLAKFRADSKFSTWLVRIATNEALMKLRKERPETARFTGRRAQG
jgi:Sigma-70 region 2